ncbi:hypothetical protein V6O07_01010 [Arthrospira platensis SPKY2]
MKFDEYLITHTEFVPRPDLKKQKIDSKLKESHIEALLYNSYNCNKRISTLIKDIKDGLNKTPLSLKYMSGLIESIILKLLTTSTISNIKATSLTNHYKRYEQKKLRKNVPYDLCKRITYGYSYIWGGLYGTPLYYNYLYKNTEHYQTPANLAHNIYSYFFRKLRENTINNILFSDLNILIDNLFLHGINSNEESSDQLIYNFHKEYLYSFKNYSQLIKIIKLIVEIETVLDIEYEINKKDKILKDLYFYMINSGIEDITNISNSVPHLELSESIESSISNLGSILNLISLKENISENIKDLFKKYNIKNFSIISLFPNFSNSLLYTIPGPGGYNDILMMLSLIILVKAFCLSHVENSGVLGSISFKRLNKFDWVGNNLENNPLIGNSFGDLSKYIKDKSKVEKKFYRVIKLIYFSGLLLRKINIPEVNIIGNNICSISGYKDNSKIRLNINI